MGKNKSKKKQRTEFARLRSLEAKLNNEMEKINREMKQREEKTAETDNDAINM